MRKCQSKDFNSEHSTVRKIVILCYLIVHKQSILHSFIFPLFSVYYVLGSGLGTKKVRMNKALPLTPRSLQSNRERKYLNRELPL